LSFGQKKTPSGFATARVLAVLHRLDDLADDAATVDVTALSSSKGGTGSALPPRPRPGDRLPHGDAGEPPPSR
jgi:hypothetical protein